MTTPTIDESEQAEAAQQLARALSGRAGLTPRAARIALIALRAVAVPPLLEALQSGEREVRWEAAKALSEIGSAAAVDAFVELLVDDDPEIRWLAAEGLVRLGEPALAPLLRELLRHSESVWLREGAHHVLTAARHEGRGAIVEPVIRELEGVVPAIAVLPAAADVLAHLEASHAGRRAIPAPAT